MLFNKIKKNSIYFYILYISGIQANQTIISDLSVFTNLEFLSISGVKLSQWPFRNLNKLIKLKIDKSDLSEFDFDSLNTYTSLQIIDINMHNDYNTTVQSFKIDLNELTNLKWLNLEFTKEQNEKTFQFIADSTNQFTKIRLKNTSIDLTVLKCLNISNVDLSKQISPQWFYGMTSLIKLNLKNNHLSNLDFLDTDGLENLEILFLSCNQITVLKKGTFSKFKKLKRLSLSNNLIEELVPGIFKGLDCLELLDIRSNRFNVESIDKKVFEALKCLKKLFIRSYEKRFDNIDYLKRDGLNIE